jgi:hypothetical protein
VEDSSVKFPDLMEEACLLDWAGVTIGKAEVRETEREGGEEEKWEREGDGIGREMVVKIASNFT